MNLTGTIKLESENLVLRKVSIADAKHMFESWASDDEVTKYLNWNTHKSIRDSINILRIWENEYQNPAFFQWIIEIKSEASPIGTISLFSVNQKEKTCEMGYCLSRKYWNLGIMSEACQLVLDFAFNTNFFNAVYARHDLKNPASGRVMEKNGMRLIDTLEEFSQKTHSTLKINKYRIRKEEFK